MYNDYISYHNKKFDRYLVKCDFKLAFDKISSHFKTDYKN